MGGDTADRQNGFGKLPERCRDDILPENCTFWDGCNTATSQRQVQGAEVSAALESALCEVGARE